MTAVFKYLKDSHTEGVTVEIKNKLTLYFHRRQAQNQLVKKPLRK